MKYIAGLLLLLLGLTGCYSKKPETTGLEGMTIPEFNLLLTDSITYFNTKSISVGRPVVLYYFSPQCSYCRAQMEEIVKNMSSLTNFQFYIFTSQSFVEMKRFYDHFKLEKYPNIVTGVDINNFFASYFNVVGVPYLAIYGKDNKLNVAYIGKTYSEQIKKAGEN